MRALSPAMFAYMYSPANIAIIITMKVYKRILQVTAAMDAPPGTVQLLTNFTAW